MVFVIYVLALVQVVTLLGVPIESLGWFCYFLTLGIAKLFIGIGYASNSDVLKTYKNFPRLGYEEVQKVTQSLHRCQTAGFALLVSALGTSIVPLYGGFVLTSTLQADVLQWMIIGYCSLIEILIAAVILGITHAPVQMELWESRVKLKPFPTLLQRMTQFWLPLLTAFQLLVTTPNREDWERQFRRAET